MAVYQFSALSRGQAISFDPDSDVLNFDASAIAAADLSVRLEGTNARVSVVSGSHRGENVLLQNVSPWQLATANVTFADGSRLLFGDDSSAQNDNGNNVLTGTGGRDLLAGFGGNDTLSGGDGEDVFLMSSGSASSYGADSISGGRGFDVLDFSGVALSGVTADLHARSVSGGGAGGAGSAVVSGMDGVIGGDFNDRLLGAGSSNLLLGNAGNDTLEGRAGDDTLEGGEGADLLRGGSGNDTLQHFGSDTDTLNGGLGDDVYIVGDPFEPDSTTVISDPDGIDTVIAHKTIALPAGIENLTMGEGVSGTGNALDNLIITRTNEPHTYFIDAREGNDTLIGGADEDNLRGGPGNDVFVFAALPSDFGLHDQLADFVPAADALQFDNRIFARLGAPGEFSTTDARFFAGPGAQSGQDASDRVIYDTSSGRLWYDGDGSGGDEPILVAVLHGAPALNASDISVIGDPTPGSIEGSAGNDSLIGTAGDDTIEGRDGDDTLDGGVGVDLLRGGDGNDTLHNHANFDPGTDTLDGGFGDDFYDVRADDPFADHSTVIFDAGGFDRILSSYNMVLPDGIENLESSGSALIGNSLDNFLFGLSNEPAQHFIDGAEGNDTLAGGQLVEMRGGPGNDVFVFHGVSQDFWKELEDFVTGTDTLQLDNRGFDHLGASGQLTSGDARFFAGAGATAGQDASDRVIYNTSNGELYYDADGSGAQGSQLIAILEGAPALVASDIIVIGEAGPDPIQGTAGNDSLTGTAGDDVLEGLGGNDTLAGLAGDDTLHSGMGDDTIRMSANYGNDVIDGGAGTDKIEFGADVLSDVTINLAAGTISGGSEGGAGSATVTSVERVMAGAFNDHVVGSAAADHLDGRRGNDSVSGMAGSDTLLGRDGDDRLEGGSGNDSLTGGAGQDSFVFADAPSAANVDQVIDFVSGTDEIVLDNGALTALGAAGNLGSGDARFWAAAGATSGHDATDRIVYNTSTGSLYYDADGSGAGTSQFVATLQGAPALLATDISVEGANVSEPALRTVINNGSSDNRVDIVCVGDGYTADQIAIDYAQDIEALIAYMFDDGLLSEPFGRYESFFNFHVIDVVSNESGADDLELGIVRDTALGATYTTRLLTTDTVATERVIDQALAGSDFQAEMAVVAVNSDKYGGSSAGIGAPAVYSAGNFWATEIALHEVAHSFAVLGDHYSEGLGHYSGPEQMNPDITTDSAGMKWARWLGYEQPGVGLIGAYEGGRGYESGLYHPSPHSKMHTVGNPFDAVGREAFILGFYDLVDPLDDYLSNTQLLRNTDEFWVDTIDPELIRVDWTINGSTFEDFGERISLEELGVSGSELTISARAYDPTEWVRVADRSSLEQTVQWDVVNDTGIIGTADNDSLTGTTGDDVIDGLGGNDTLAGLAGDDTLNGGTGNDAIRMGALYGNDVIDGGAGTDKIEFGADVVSDLTINLAAGTISGGGEGGAGSATVTSVERVMAGAFNDHVVGSDTADYLDGRRGNDRVFGLDGNDTLLGRDGNDFLVGHEGNDTLTGGAGIDAFLFGGAAPGAAHADRITDFAPGTDELWLEKFTLTAIGPLGDFSAGDARFWAAAGATSGHDATDRIVYNTSTGSLYYDADGSGSGAAQLLGTFAGNPAIAASDFTVVT